MKRGLVLSLGAALVAAMAGPAFAVVNVQLNLRYTDPANPTGGGTWDLLAKSDTAGMQGIAGLSLTIGGNLGVTGVDTPLAAITPNAAVFTGDTGVFKFEGDATSTHIVVGDDLVAGSLILNVGKGAGTPGNVADDDLFPTNSTFWDNSALLASGSWTGARPTLTAADIGGNEFDGASAAVLATVGTVSVRGDSVGVDGLKAGDTDRNGVVNLSDLGTLAGKFGTTTGAIWADGNFDSNGNVNLSDLGALAGNFGLTSPAPAISAVPEPASASLLALAGIAIVRAARRRAS